MARPSGRVAEGHKKPRLKRSQRGLTPISAVWKLAVCTSSYLPCLLCVWAVSPLCAGEEATPPAEQPPVAETKKDLPAEADVRKRFLAAYLAAQDTEQKVKTVGLLRGLKELESQRLLVGMLGSTHAAVRRTACDVMAATPDPEGYFVKPLMGALTDHSPTVRLAAAAALGNATVRAAIKALVYTLADLAGGVRPGSAADDAQLAETCDRALQKLSGEKSEKREVRGLSEFLDGLLEKTRPESSGPGSAGRAAAAARRPAQG